MRQIKSVKTTRKIHYGGADGLTKVLRKGRRVQLYQSAPEDARTVEIITPDKRRVVITCTEFNQPRFWR